MGTNDGQQFVRFVRESGFWRSNFRGTPKPCTSCRPRRDERQPSPAGKRATASHLLGRPRRALGLKLRPRGRLQVPWLRSLMADRKPIVRCVHGVVGCCVACRKKLVQPSVAFGEGVMLGGQKLVNSPAYRLTSPSCSGCFVSLASLTRSSEPSAPACRPWWPARDAPPARPCFRCRSRRPRDPWSSLPWALSPDPKVRLARAWARKKTPRCNRVKKSRFHKQYNGLA